MLALSCAPVYAQKQWSIEECIQWAIDHNIRIKQSQVRVDEGIINRQGAKWAYVPSLNANTGYNVNAGRSLDQTTYSYTTKTAQGNSSSVSMGTQVFAGMKKMYNLQKANLDLDALIAQKEDLQMDITIQVAASYLQVLFNKEQIKNSEAQLETTKSQFEQIKQMVDAGAQPLSAQLEIEAQIASEEYNLVSYKNTLATNTLTLKQLLELPYGEEFDILVPDISNLDEYTISSVDEVNDAAQILPTIRAAEYQLKSAEKSFMIAKAGLYPTISFSASYGSSWNSTRLKQTSSGTTSYSFWDQYKDNASGGFGFTMSIPILNTFSQRRNVQLSRWGIVDANLSLYSSKNELYKEIQQAYTDAVGALEQYHSAEKSVASLSTAFDITSKKFSVGSATSTDYIQSKNILTNAENTLIQAKYTFLFRTKILNYYKGEPITF